MLPSQHLTAHVMCCSVCCVIHPSTPFRVEVFMTPHTGVLVAHDSPLSGQALHSDGQIPNPRENMYTVTGHVVVG